MESTAKEHITSDSATDATTTGATESLNTSGISINSDELEPSEFTEEESKRAEEYKTQGNEFFKCKCLECREMI